MSHDRAIRHLPPDWDALARYHRGESPVAEAREVERWLASHPRDAAMLGALDGVLFDVGPGAPGAGTALRADVDVEAALERVKARRDAAGGAREAGVVPLRTSAPRRRVRPAWVFGGLAAAAALFAVAWQRESPTAAATGPTLVETAVGQRDSLQLPDGSTVLLAPASRLEVARDYGEGARSVRLEGAAVFHVVHDETRPFTVRTGNAVVRDLGTVFSVRAGGPGDGVTVAVTEGSVALRGATARDSVVLDAGDRASLDAHGAIAAERGVVAADDLAWARGTLVYRSAPLTIVADDLRRWYGIELRVADPALASRRLTATFEREDPARILSVIALALGAEVTRDGDVATLRATRPAAR